MELLVIIIAGIGAGLVTGLVGASAAVVVTPLLVTFTSIEAYVAITIALATDVFASSISAYTYKKEGHINIASAKLLVLTAILGSLVGSWLSSNMSQDSLGNSTAVIALLMGLSFIRKKPKTEEDMNKPSKMAFFRERKTLSALLFGTIIGLICGIVGAGGGIMIFIILTTVLGLGIKEAIGTSVLIMTFTAFSGAVGHMFHIEGTLPFLEILVCGLASIIGARIGAKTVTKAEESQINKIIGIAFLSLSLILYIGQFMA